MKTSYYEALKDVADKLRTAGARLPIVNEGTMESAHRAGLSVALVIVEEALASARTATPPPDKIRDILDAIDDYANGKLILIELLFTVGLPLPRERKVRSLALRVMELEEQNKALQERVAFAERDRDAAVAAAEEVKAKAKEKARVAGEHLSKVTRTARQFYKKQISVDQVAASVVQIATDLGVPLVLEPGDDSQPRSMTIARSSPMDPVEQVKAVVEQLANKAIETSNKLKAKCRHCRDTGVIETGNNDLPCEACIKGRYAVFSGGQTGEDVFRSYNNQRPLPGAWTANDVSSDR